MQGGRAAHTTVAFASLVLPSPKYHSPFSHFASASAGLGTALLLGADAPLALPLGSATEIAYMLPAASHCCRLGIAAANASTIAAQEELQQLEIQDPQLVAETHGLQTRDEPRTRDTHTVTQFYLASSYM